ncbi:Glyoxalase-like domain-containing protein [Amycolatopsis marina]|uniref:Glyoxalase-like domain-containing protein n=1 Tax=Amycolatopsis marina TaxID=490629 RepID=A0A1I1C0Y9_9PSEU|nr:VOC family protein [Amycolatopsis marina]SFB56314.1 Glyoxalase-like domain-containing protein [Amycolatopsis marina]
MRLRQVALIAHDLSSVVDDVRSVLGVEVCLTIADEIQMWGEEMVDEFGISNAVFVVGDTFLEVISPRRDGTPAARYLELRGGDSGYMVLVQTDDLDRGRARAESAGYRMVWQSPLKDVRGVHFDPRDIGGSLLSLEQPEDATEWPWAGYNWRAAARTDVTTEIVGVEVQARDPSAAAAHWAGLLESVVSANGDGCPEVVLDRGRVRFRQGDPARAEGVCGVEVRCVEPAEVLRRARDRGLPVTEDRVTICGVAFRIMGTG